jgi:hypothetical protein
VIATASPLVIEFLGLPGAGKSTLAARLVEHLRSQGRSCGDRSGLGLTGGRAGHYARLAAHTVGSSRRFPAALRLAAAVTPFSTARWRFASRLAVWPYRLSVAQKREYNPVVLDQGPLQVTWCVLLEGRLRHERVLQEAISELVASTGLSFILIYVDVTPELAAARIEARGPMFRPFHRGRAKNIQLLGEHRGHLEHVLAVAEASTGAPVLRVDGGRPLDESGSRIEAFVDRFLTDRVS